MEKEGRKKEKEEASMNKLFFPLLHTIPRCTKEIEGGKGGKEGRRGF